MTAAYVTVCVQYVSWAGLSPMNGPMVHVIILKQQSDHSPLKTHSYQNRSNISNYHICFDNAFTFSNTQFTVSHGTFFIHCFHTGQFPYITTLKTITKMAKSPESCLRQFYVATRLTQLTLPLHKMRINIWCCQITLRSYHKIYLTSR